jgi:protein-L-isoaspartate(D-aspartate) O-methyltransferase
VDFSRERERIVEGQLAGGGVRDPRVLAAMGQVPREAFVPNHLRNYAYEDGPLSIGHRQTISQPLVVAEMLQAAEIGPEHCVLDVGTGSAVASSCRSAPPASSASFAFAVEPRASTPKRTSASCLRAPGPPTGVWNETHVPACPLGGMTHDGQQS